MTELTAYTELRRFETRTDRGAVAGRRATPRPRRRRPGSHRARTFLAGLEGIGHRRR